MSTHLLSKYADLGDVQLDGMIAYAHRSFPFLEISTPDGLKTLCHLMVSTNFAFDKKPTPIRASFEFLRKLPVEGAPTFAERDFVFAIKMFGLLIREKNGVIQFVPGNRIDLAEDEEVLIQSSKDAKQLEFYVSDVHKHTKIQTHTIQSATNKLLREWREIEMARHFAEKIAEGASIGEAREYLRTSGGVKDHEFVRIRQHAIDLGLFQSKRSPSRVSRRITLDEDNVEFVEKLAKSFAKGRSPVTMSQAANRALRDFKKLISEKPGSGNGGAG